MEETVHKPARLLKPKPKSRKKLIIYVVGVVLVVSFWLGYSYYSEKKFLSKVPSVLRPKQAFQVYYPDNLPKAYEFVDGSYKKQDGLIFYSLRNGSDQIIVSEQSLPDEIPDVPFLSSNNIKLPSGEAIIGKGTFGNLATIKTKTTLINISSSKNIPYDVFVEIASNMRSLP